MIVFSLIATLVLLQVAALLFCAPRRWRYLLWPQLALVCTLTVVAYLGGFPEFMRVPTPWDKVLHFLLFGALALWTELWLSGSRHRRMLGFAPPSVSILLLVAAAEEFAQSFSPNRTADPLDFVADACGIVLFFAIARLIAQRVADQGRQQPL